MKITKKLIEEHGFTPKEYRTVLDILGREPTFTELGIFSVMWSEHCSYKSSRLLLKKFPTTGKHVLQGPGENAGAVSIGDGQAAIFKMESHNHPSFIEPYQGAATGVGGILRDIFTMGARPIASMNSLHFGPLDVPKNRFLLPGVVAGIAGYGNCMGIPTVGGEVIFNHSYNGNPIINVFSLGIAPEDGIFLGVASGDGNPVIYVGSKTGKDGIHGATMASEEFDETSEERRPTVQVGDPFTEKCLLEACIELFQTDTIVAIQDMGAAGLTCSTVEMSSRGGVGMEIDLQKVPKRESLMSCYELMLSESQERMLIVAKPGREQEVIDIYKKWDLEACVIGKVIKDDLLIVKDGDETVAEIPASTLTEQSPVYKRPRKVPERLKVRPQNPPRALDKKLTIEKRFEKFVTHYTQGTREWIYEQYDHMVRTNTVLRPGSDAAVIRIKHTPKALAMSVDSNPLHCYCDPYQGAIMTVCESARNLACAGAEPLAITDCLNFGSPENPTVMWEFARAVEGITRACEFLDIPVISGNVSFYNETLGNPIFPTPTIGMVGLIPESTMVGNSSFKNPGDVVYLVGPQDVHLGASLYLYIMENRVEGPPPKPDLKKERKYQECIRQLVREKLLQSAHDISDGGLATALTESCVSGNKPIGVTVNLENQTDADFEDILFGEGSARFIISCQPNQCENVEKILRKNRAAFMKAGNVGGKKIDISINKENVISSPVEKLYKKWKTSLAESLDV